MNYKSGFCGHDSMREKAIKEFGPEMRGLSMHTPESNSSKARTNMRLYKKGGKVHGLTSMQVDLYIPKRAKQCHQKASRFEKVEHRADGGMIGQPDDLNTRIQMANEMLGNANEPGMGIKRGGKVHHKHHRTHKLDGGMMGLSNMGRKDLNAGRSALGLKHGGKSHHKAHGGTMGSGRNQDDSGLMLRGEPLEKGFHSHAGLKHGGKTRRAHKADGGDLGGSVLKSAFLGPLAHVFKRGGKAHHKHKSEGGPMRGESPTTRQSTNNYESNMVGEKKAPNAMRHGGKTHRIHKFDGGDLYESMVFPHTIPSKILGLKHGGKAHRKHKLGGLLGDMRNQLLNSRINAGNGLTGINSGNGLKRGGKAHHKHKSEGGPMRGEHPGRHASENNYESNMRGEHRVHHKADGGKMGAYAAGGVGKIRHGQMTISGKPILPRHKIKHG